MDAKSRLRQSKGQTFLLFCGVLSPAMYAAADAIAGISWTEYSFRDHTISELGAVGAPTQGLFSLMLLPTYLALLAFGIGVWSAGRTSRPLRVAGAFLLAFAILALTVGQFVPMKPRGATQGMSGMLHLVEGAVAMAFILSAMLSAALAFRTPFRAYTLATVLMVLGFGFWSGLDAPRVEAGLDTPWLGVKERVFWYAYQLWFAVLALALMREGRVLK